MELRNSTSCIVNLNYERLLNRDILNRDILNRDILNRDRPEFNMLAYYVQWHMQQRLNPIFDGDGLGSKRRWSFAGIIECLRQRCRHTISIHDVQYQQDGELTDEQERIVNLLEMI